jgi:hypothetical protein
MHDNLPEAIRRGLARATDHEARRVAGVEVNEITDKVVDAIARSRELIARVDKLLSRR